MPATHRLTLRDTPLLISMPHCGTVLPHALQSRLTDAALRLPDTDWHLAELYDFAAEIGAGTLVPIYSRYLIDLNRDPEGQPLYAGARNSELCPLTTFADAPIYRGGEQPGAQEIAERVDHYWRPYHAAIETALAHLRQRHGCAVLFEAHSIASRVPRFFDGRLPDFNFGSNADTTLPAAVSRKLQQIVEADGRYSAVCNGRFKGGYITRQYAQPQARIYSLQLELSQAVYMVEDGHYLYDEGSAAPVKPLLRHVLESLLEQVQALP